MSAQEIFEQYKTRMGQSRERILKGIKNPKRSPTQAAIDNKDKMRANWQKAMDAGRWEKGLQESGDERWRNNFEKVGVDKITTGIEANKTKILAAFEKVDAAGKAVREAVKGMPNNNIEDALAIQRRSMEIQKQMHGKS